MICKICKFSKFIRILLIEKISISHNVFDIISSPAINCPTSLLKSYLICILHFSVITFPSIKENPCQNIQESLLTLPIFYRKRWIVPSTNWRRKFPNSAGMAPTYAFILILAEEDAGCVRYCKYFILHLLP